jgi:laminin alpha 3/5
VIGEKCDHCPYRWVLKEDEGCFECDSCIHDLLDVTDRLRAHIDPIADEFEVRGKWKSLSSKALC